MIAVVLRSSWTVGERRALSLQARYAEGSFGEVFAIWRRCAPSSQAAWLFLLLLEGM